MEWSLFTYGGVMARLLLVVVLGGLIGCRSVEKTTYSVESTARSAVNPYDDKVIDKIDLTITIRKSW